MKVCLVCAVPRDFKSIHAYVDGLSTAMKAVRPRWEVVVWPERPDALYRNDATFGSKIDKYVRRFIHYPMQIGQIDANVFHIVENSNAHLCGRLRSKNKNVVVTCHDIINEYYKDDLRYASSWPWMSARAWSFATRRLAQADHIIAVSAFTARDIETHLAIDPARISVVPNGVDPAFRRLPEPSRRDARARFMLSDADITLLNIGSDLPRKNIITILEAVSIMAREGINVKFVKAGADFSKEEKRFIDQNGIERHTSYVGPLDLNALVQLYNAADIYVAPSLYEGFGMTVAEAIACGTPVIAANAGSLPEVVGDAGMLIDPMDAAGMAARIKTFRTDPAQWRRLVNNGLRRRQLFSWERAADAIAGIYERVIDGRSVADPSPSTPS